MPTVLHYEARLFTERCMHGNNVCRQSEAEVDAQQEPLPGKVRPDDGVVLVVNAGRGFAEIDETVLQRKQEAVAERRPQPHADVPGERRLVSIRERMAGQRSAFECGSGPDRGIAASEKEAPLSMSNPGVPPYTLSVVPTKSASPPGHRYPEVTFPYQPPFSCGSAAFADEPTLKNWVPYSIDLGRDTGSPSSAIAIDAAFSRLISSASLLCTNRTRFDAVSLSA